MRVAILVQVVDGDVRLLPDYVVASTEEMLLFIKLLNCPISVYFVLVVDAGGHLLPGSERRARLFQKL